MAATRLISMHLQKSRSMRWTKGKHAFIVATHVDKAHIHNHIVYNSTTLDAQHKWAREALFNTVWLDCFFKETAIKRYVAYFDYYVSSEKCFKSSA